jgi:hypothetical protein
MAPRKEIFHAVAFHSECDAAEPLIQQEHHQPDEKVLRSLQFSALVLGLLVGFFIQFSTLGANFLFINIYGEDAVTTKSKGVPVLLSLLWSCVTSAMAVGILGLLRNLVTHAYHAIRRESEEVLADMMLCIEYRFIVGDLVGVCMAWTMTDILLGMHEHILSPFVTLGVSLLFCQVVYKCFALPTERPKIKVAEPFLIV